MKLKLTEISLTYGFSRSVNHHITTSELTVGLSWKVFSHFNRPITCVFTLEWKTLEWKKIYDIVVILFLQNIPVLLPFQTELYLFAYFLEISSRGAFPRCPSELNCLEVTLVTFGSLKVLYDERFTPCSP